MSPNDFQNASTEALEKTAHFFETSWAGADTDLFEDALTVQLRSGRLYLFNKHGVTRQIWVASPFTGAHHFKQNQNDWVCTRTGVSLDHFLAQEKAIYAT